jgi:hypothetical protein
MQLDALLRSYASMTRNTTQLFILFASSSRDYKIAYETLIDLHASRRCTFVHEESFGTFSNAFESLLDRILTRTIFFLVDDDLFIRPVDLGLLALLASKEVIPSLRLGSNVTWSYTREKRQLLPHFRVVKSSATTIPMNVHDKLIAWKWRSGDVDWGYPGSLDGNIFLTSWIKRAIQTFPYSAPNSLESGLNKNLYPSHNLWGLCFSHSRIVNSPINRVQVEVDNIHGTLHQDLLLSAWLSGYRMNIEGLGQITNSSAHQEIRLPLTQDAGAS